MIHSPRILDAQLARHPDIQDYAQTTVNSQNDPSYGLTPFHPKKLNANSKLQQPRSAQEPEETATVKPSTGHPQATCY